MTTEVNAPAENAGTPSPNDDWQNNPALDDNGNPVENPTPVETPTVESIPTLADKTQTSAQQNSAAVTTNQPLPPTNYTTLDDIVFATFSRRNKKAHLILRHCHKAATKKMKDYLKSNPQDLQTIPVPQVFDHETAAISWNFGLIDVVSVPIPYNATNRSECTNVLFYRVPFSALPSKKKRKACTILNAFLQVHSKYQLLFCPPL